MRCVAGRTDARRGAHPMALPLASVATQQTPSSRATRRAGRSFGDPEPGFEEKNPRSSSKSQSKRRAKRTSGALARKARQAARSRCARAMEANARASLHKMHKVKRAQNAHKKRFLIVLSSCLRPLASAGFAAQRQQIRNRKAPRRGFYVHFVYASFCALCVSRSCLLFLLDSRFSSLLYPIHWLPFAQSWVDARSAGAT